MLRTLKAKPDKPRDDFPLFPHASGVWAKKVRGKLHYFGPWSDPQVALDKWLDQKDDLLAGRTPRLVGDGATVRDLVNRFLTSKRHLADTREITAKTFADYYRTCEKVIAIFGRNRLVIDLGPEDFETLRGAWSKLRGPVGLANEIQRARVLFKYAYDQGLIDRPVRYGQTFKKPSKRILRQARIDAGPRMFEAKEIKAILKEAGIQMKAMVLLAINCGFGNTDIASLPLSALTLRIKVQSVAFAVA